MNRIKVLRSIFGKRFAGQEIQSSNFWEPVLQREAKRWRQFKESAKGKLVLIATSTGGHRAVTPVESLLAASLTIRGAKVHFLLCDKMLPACLQATYQSFKDSSEFPNFGPQKSLCDDCYGYGRKTYEPFNLPIHLYSQYITNKEIEAINKKVADINISKISTFHEDNIAVGEHAEAGAIRYFAMSSINEEPFAEKVLLRYLAASLITKHVIEQLLARNKFDIAVFHHGIYVPQGIVGEVMRKNGVRVVNWNPAYRKKCFIFSHNDTYHHTLLSEPTSKWDYLTLTQRNENKLTNYLKSRWTGSDDWIWFHEHPQFDNKKIIREVGINSRKPVIGMLTNVMWDAQLHYRDNAFPNMLTWIIETIRYFEKRNDLQLVIRVHPAEIRGTVPSRQRVTDEIKRVFPVLPKNVFIVVPESTLSTYAVMKLCNTVLIYGTKTGVELTSMGIPVIVAGEAWIRNKGLTLDSSSVRHYSQLLDRLPFKSRMNKKTRERARKYAYHFFFRRMIPVSCIEPVKGWPPYELRLKSLDQLMPGRDPGLDTICDGILKGTDFVYKDEILNK